MSEITTGTLIADRYRLTSRAESDLSHAAVWLAQDQILDRPVRVIILTGTFADDAIEEARRAALVSDPRIVRTIDAGNTGDIRYVVTEEFAGEDLSVLTSGRPLPHDQAQAIIGEAATALEVARKRGVHHCALRPHSIHLEGGRVRITGLGVDGALNPNARRGHLTADRTDVVGLTSLLFYALTGLWPTKSFTTLELESGLVLPELALTADGHPDMATLNPETPEGLRILIQTILTNRSAGPRTPGELADELSPWGPITAAPPHLFDRVIPATPAGPGTTPFNSPWPEIPTQNIEHPNPKGDVSQPLQPQQNNHPTHDGGPAPEHETHAAPTPLVRQSIRSAFNAPTRPALPGTPPPAVPTSEPGRVARKSVLGAPTAAAPTQSGVSSLFNQTQTPSWNPPAAHPPANTVRPNQGRPVQQPAEPTLTFEELMTKPSEFRRFKFNPTRLTLIIAIVLLVIGIPLAIHGLTSGLSNPFAEKEITRPVPQETGGPTGKGEPGETAATQAPVTPPVTPVIASGQQLDPQGDNNEHPEAVSKAFDQDPSTFWYTRTYKSASFAGLGKDGIGFAVELEEKTAVSTVYLSTNNTGGNVEVRATDPKNPTSGKVLASGALTDELILELDETVETKYIVLWFTELPQTPQGDNRVELREISLT